MKFVARPLLALLLLVPMAASAEAVRCVDDHARCREGCTMEFGTSYRTRQKLGLCIEACTRDYRDCEASFAKALEKPTRKAQPKPQPKPQRATRQETRSPEPAPEPTRGPPEDRTIAASAAPETPPAAKAPERRNSAAISSPNRRPEVAGIPLPAARKPKKKRDLFDWHPGDPE